MRVVFAGEPRCGKTTCADAYAAASRLDARRTDDLIGKLEWSALSAEVATWLDAPGPYVVEGVRAGHALRKWLAAHPGDALPCDVVYWAEKPKVPRTPGQVSMGKAAQTIWAEILPELRRRGVEIREVP